MIPLMPDRTMEALGVVSAGDGRSCRERRWSWQDKSREVRAVGGRALADLRVAWAALASRDGAGARGAPTTSSLPIPANPCRASLRRTSRRARP